MTPRPRATDRLPVVFIATPPMRGHRTYLDLSPRASQASPCALNRVPAIEAGRDANRGEG